MLPRADRLTTPRPLGDHGRPTTRRPTTDRPTTDHGPVSLEEAADRLGITVNAVCHRLKRGTLGGHKTPAGWVVVWPPTRATDHGPTIDAAWSVADQPTTNRPTNQPTKGTPAVSDAARRQLEAIRDEWLAPMVGQIREQAEEIGRLRAERQAVAEERDRLRLEREDDRRLASQLVDLLQAERDELRAEVERLRVSPESPPADNWKNVEPAREVSAQWWRRWLRQVTERA